MNLRVPVSADDEDAIRRARAEMEAREAEFRRGEAAFRRVVVDVATRSSDRETAKVAHVSTNTLTRWKRDT